MPFPVKPCMMKSSLSTEGKVLGAQMRNTFMDLERWWRNDKRNTKIAWPSRTSQLWPRSPGCQWPRYRSYLLVDHERDLPRLVLRDEFSGSHGKARKRKYSRVPRMPYACVSDARPILVAYMAMPKEKEDNNVRQLGVRSGRHPWIRVPSHKAGREYQRKTIAHTGHGLRWIGRRAV